MSKIGPGPGNVRIATALLEILAARGDVAARSRARDALGLDARGLASAPRWLTTEAIESMFDRVPVDPRLARRLGQAVLRPDGGELFLYSMGLATPEKAYRRVQVILPRESQAGEWEAVEIDRECARLRYAPAPDAKLRKAAFCAARIGMLESVPGLYGLLPAQVREHACVDRGDSHCEYEVRWSRTSHRGLGIGALIGVPLAAGASALVWLGPIQGLALPGAVFGALSLAMLLAGRAHDLSRQLEAVAGARRGQLALLDQADSELAEKLDALATAGAKLDERPGPGRRPMGEVARLDHSELVGYSAEVGQRIHAHAGDLHRELDGLVQVVQSQAGPPELRALRAALSECLDEASALRELGAELAHRAAPDGGPQREIDLAALVERALAGARPGFDVGVEVELDLEEGLPSVRCEPLQIEQVVIQLLKNAARAAGAEAPVKVTLRSGPTGIELSVEDSGGGIPHDTLDEVFDPFFGDRSPAVPGGGFGLPVCLRIVENHGGELRVASNPERGTRVTVLLPVELLGARPNA